MFLISLAIPIAIAPISMPEDPDMEELERELNQLVVSGNTHSNICTVKVVDLSIRESWMSIF